MNKHVITSLDDAVEFFWRTMEANPRRDALAAQRAAVGGRPRPHAAISIGHLDVPGDAGGEGDCFVLPEVHAGDDERGRLAREVIGMLAPLDMHNPVMVAFSLGVGTATLAPAFGAELNAEAGNQVSRPMTLREILDRAVPDVETSGLMPQIRRRIETIRSLTPPSFKIGIADMQGPFNLLHAMCGDEAFLGPHIDGERFDRAMARITGYWIAAFQAMRAWIGLERQLPLDRWPRVAECSVNMVSGDFYRRFILPFDRQIAEALGPMCIHPCSGPHVFLATLEHLPVAATEAGWIAKAAAGAIGVDEALAAIGDRPIVLRIGQELPQGDEYDFIRRDLDRCASNKRLLMGYTGMHWRRKDRPFIREMHLRLDEYWAASLSTIL